MINLLPTDYKEDLFYARRNTQLRRWITTSLVALLGIGLIIAGGLLYMQQSINSYNKQLAQSREDLKTQKITDTQKQLEDISNNTKLTVQVLSKEVLFSKLLKQIGAALPARTVLNSLQLDKIQGGVQLNAGAGSFYSATQIQVNLQDPKNGVFEKADINSITCGAAPTADSPNRLPCTVSLRALFSKNSNYYYLQPGSTTGAKQ